MLHTEHSGRKTPHAVTDNLYGGKSIDTVWAWCFENDNPDGRLVRKHISKSNCYVAENNQDLEDYKFKDSDIRKWHTAVWNQKSMNLEKHGFFKTNYEIKRMQEDNATVLNFIAD